MRADPKFRYLSVRRADYQEILHEAAVERRCEIRLDQKVVDIQEDLPGVQLQDGTVVRGDLIVIADGKPINASDRIL